MKTARPRASTTATRLYPKRMHACGPRCAAILRDYTPGATQKALGAKYHCSATTVYHILREHGAALRGRGMIPDTKGWHREAVRLYRAGWTQAAIARQVGYTPERVRQVLYKHGLCGPRARAS